MVLTKSAGSVSMREIPRGAPAPGSDSTSVAEVSKNLSLLLSPSVARSRRV
jgi:hypothetical protein